MKYKDRFIQKISSKVIKKAQWPMPTVINGNGSILRLAAQVKEDGLKKVLIITTQGTIKRGTIDQFLDELKISGVEYEIFNEVMPDPTIACINQAAEFYKEKNCEGIIAIGGGSVLDCAKVAGARIVKPELEVAKMAGTFKIGTTLPPFYAVPTTAGTGSETTVAAVVTDETTHKKFAVSDAALLPRYAVLDPVLTKDMPPQLTAYTGMDAMTHAVEAYTNLYTMPESDEKAKKAVKFIMKNLLLAYDHGEKLSRRRNMLLASFYAGEAFTRSFVGYVHAIAHAVGGLYGVPHGEANAIILPYVLDAYGPHVYKTLSELAEASELEVTGNQEENAKAFIRKLREMNQHMHIAEHLPMILEEDIPEIANRVAEEAHAYPTPVIWSKKELKKLILTIKGETKAETAEEEKAE